MEGVITSLQAKEQVNQSRLLGSGAGVLACRTGGPSGKSEEGNKQTTAATPFNAAAAHVGRPDQPGDQRAAMSLQPCDDRCERLRLHAFALHLAIQNPRRLRREP